MNPDSIPSAPMPVLRTLFCVMLPWNPNDSEEGTYETNVWAANADEAERLVAEEMADHSDSGCETDEERTKFAQNLIDSGLSVITEVTEKVKSDVRDLLAGPGGDLEGQAKEDYETIVALLATYQKI